MRKEEFNMPMLCEKVKTNKGGFYAPVKATPKEKQIKAAISREIEVNCCLGIEAAISNLVNELTTSLNKGDV